MNPNLYPLSKAENPNDHHAYKEKEIVYDSEDSDAHLPPSTHSGSPEFLTIFFCAIFDRETHCATLSSSARVSELIS